MTCLIKNNKGVLDSLQEEIVKLEGMDEGEYQELYGTSLVEDLDTLKGLKDAADAKDAEYIRSEKKSVLSAEEANSELNLAFKTYSAGSDGRFTFSWKGSDKVANGILKNIEKRKNLYHLTFLSGGKTYTYKFSPESGGRSVDTKNGSFIVVPKIADTLHRDIYKRKVLHSNKKSTARSLPESMKQSEYKHGTVESMKEMLNKLNILGGEKANSKEMRWLESLFDKMSPEFFTEMELYLDESAKDSYGTVTAKYKEDQVVEGRIDIGVNKDAPTIGNQQTEASVYAEEVMHSMTMFAIALASTDKTKNGLEARKLVRKLDFLMETTRKNLRISHLLPEVSINAEKEQREAEELLKYITEGKPNKYEFVAKILTVPELRDAVAKIKVSETVDKNATLLDKIVDVFAKLLNVILGNYTFKERNENVLEGTLNLAYSLGEINKKAADNAKDQGMMDIAIDMLNEADYNVSKVFDGLKSFITNDAELTEQPKSTDSKYTKVKWLAKSLYLILTNGTYTKAAGYIVTQLGLPPESTIREVISGLFPTEPAQKMAEILSLQAGFIDKKRNTQIEIIKAGIFDKFSEGFKATVRQEEALTDIIADLDLSLIMDNKSFDGSTTVYDNKTVRNLLKDDLTLDNRITKVKAALRKADKDNYAWHSSQAIGLGRKLATHVGTRNQNNNAENIVSGFLSTHRKAIDKEVVNLVDELATLYGIKYADKKSKVLVEELMRTEYKGVKHIADMYEGFKINSDNTAFKDSRVHKAKGYRKSIYDNTVATEIAPLEDREKMEKAGYEYKYTLTAKEGQVVPKQLALYATSSFSRDDRLRGATRLNTSKAKGQSLRELHYQVGRTDPYASGKREIDRIQKLSLKDSQLAEKGKFNTEDAEYGISPIINEQGKVVDYAFNISKQNKKLLLKEDTRISEVMSKSYGSLLDKEASSEHNANVLNNIITDMKANFEISVLDSDYQVGKDGVTEYAVIRKDAISEDLRSIWSMMPREFRIAAEKRSDNSLAVPRSMLNLYFGYTQLSITDFPGLKKVTPKVIVNLIKFVEELWVDLIKIVKTNILLKTPAVPIGNMISNFFLEVFRGSNPITVLRMYKESYRDIKKYNKDSRTVQELTNAILKTRVRLGKDTLSSNVSADLKNSIAIDRREIKLLTKGLEENPVHVLMEMGLDQSVEDLESEADTNVWSKLGSEKVFSKVPEVVKQGFDIAYLGKSTKWYKLNHEVLELSDLVARDTRLRLDREKSAKQEEGKLSLPSWWVDGKPEGYSRKQALIGAEREEFRKQSLENIKYDLIEDFINYTLPSSRMEEYLNRVGILMFTKYVKRIQRVILKQSGQGPIKAIIGMLAVGYLGGLPSIYEQSFLAKDWYTDSVGPGNIFPVYDPVHQMLNFATPALLKSSTYDLTP